jgi:hypothetical protein
MGAGVTSTTDVVVPPHSFWVPGLRPRIFTRPIIDSRLRFWCRPLPRPSVQNLESYFKEAIIWIHPDDLPAWQKGGKKLN